MKSGRSNSLTKIILVIGSLPALLAVSRFFTPSTLPAMPICVFKLTLGLPCLGCGLTRAFCSMAHLDLVTAIHHHLLAPAVLLFFFAWYLVGIYRLFRKWEKPRLWRYAVNTLIIAMFFFWSGRMVMFFSSDRGYLSLLNKNLPMRIIHGDWSNTWEPWE